MKKIKLLLLTLACTTIFATCKKTNTTTDEPQLPPETQTGAYTFGCKVDGKIFTATGKGGLLGSQSMYYNIRATDSSIKIGVENSVSKFSIDLRVKYLGTYGVYLMKKYDYYGNFQDNSNGTIPGNSNFYYTDSVNIGKLNVKYFNGTLNPVFPGNILAGTFEMDAVNANGKVVRITEGRFDIGQ